MANFKWPYKQTNDSLSIALCRVMTLANILSFQVVTYIKGCKK